MAYYHYVTLITYLYIVAMHIYNAMITRIFKLILITSLILSSYMVLSIYHHELYDIDNYCCKEMGRDIEDILESVYIPVIIEIGLNEDGDRHLWVSVGGFPIDSVTLLPCDNYNEYCLEHYTFNDYQDYKDYKSSICVSI